MKSPITTHVLDTTQGCPGRGIEVVLDYLPGDTKGHWSHLAKGVTDADGRVSTLLPTDHALAPGIYRLTFHITSPDKRFYPYIPIVFSIEDPNQHYHVPLLLSPFGYSTYRGS